MPAFESEAICLLLKIYSPLPVPLYFELFFVFLFIFFFTKVQFFSGIEVSFFHVVTYVFTCAWCLRLRQFVFWSRDHWSCAYNWIWFTCIWVFHFELVFVFACLESEPSILGPRYGSCPPHCKRHRVSESGTQYAERGQSLSLVKPSLRACPWYWLRYISPYIAYAKWNSEFKHI